MMEYLGQVILLLLAAISIVVVFQRLHFPTSLGYLLVGVILGPYTMGPVVSMPGLQVLAEFGIVFLLFTIGLGYSLPQLNALRHQIVGLGTGQVVITTAVLGLLAWLCGLPVAAAFVLGAVFAQSSTTIISNIVSEQGEDYGRYGRLGLAMSVFQDVTTVPFLVIIPVLGTAISALVLAQALVLALAKAILALAVVFLAGRWLLRPLFHAVSQNKSLELFTLAVLLVTLVAAWTTNNLGLFFVGIGMRFDPAALLTNWSIVLLAAPLVVMTVAQPEVALKALSYLSRICPQVPVIARARDLESSAMLQKAGALHAHPETIEASLRLGAIALELLKVPTGEIEDELQNVRDWGYTPVADPKPESGW